MKRFAPAVEAPYGTHQNCCTPSFSKPRTWPYCVFAVPPTVARRRSCAEAIVDRPPNARPAPAATPALKKVLRSSPKLSLPCREAIVRSPGFLIERLAWPTIRQGPVTTPNRPVRLNKLCSRASEPRPEPLARGFARVHALIQHAGDAISSPRGT